MSDSKTGNVEEFEDIETQDDGEECLTISVSA